MGTHSNSQIFIIILMIALGVQITRWLPFVLFPENRTPPKFITALGRILPPAVIGLLLVYCLKGITPTAFPYGIPELISVTLIAVLHMRWKNSLLSIGAGAAVYILLVRLVFV